MSGQFEIMNMDMKMGTTLKIKGKIADCTDGFVINLGQGTDKLNLHFNPRFNESTIVCNTWDGNCWGEEQRDSHTCFRLGSEVKGAPASLMPSFPLQLLVTFDNNEFKVKMPDGHQLTFPNRLGHNHLSYLSVQGGFSISSFKLE
ncbi:galectin-2 isoform X1 [Neophocaena asiaeorientalis asiaeorientalis]|uniref:Galectin n=1 Tax=Neophocaena asiaeorientalis asiaeorientalis TaxID=1706337 RepID=A0A341CRC8_NEOAA|nr:galectin-2 isoform X1 [Neophocaena asiaeorientalis asiaeorientalis]